MSVQVNTSVTSKSIKDNIDGTFKSKFSTEDDQLKMFVEGSGDAEIQELKEEAQDLVDDQVYNDFITAIAKEKPVNSVEESEKDEEFVPVGTVTTDTNNSHEKDECGSNVSGSESSTSSSEEDSEDPNIDPEELKLLQNEVPVAIPKDSLMAKQERYPFFWRYKHSVRNVENEEYKSDEDPEYIPKNYNDAEEEGATNDAPSKAINGKENDAESSSSASESEGEGLNEVAMEDESKLKEMHDVQEDLKGLIDMVEEMSFVHDSKNLVGDVKEAQNEDKEEDDAEVSEEGESATNYEDALDDSNYNEEADSDYKPEEDFFYAVVQKDSEDLSDSSSSSSFIENDTDMAE